MLKFEQGHHKHVVKLVETIVKQNNSYQTNPAIVLFLMAMMALSNYRTVKEYLVKFREKISLEYRPHLKIIEMALCLKTKEYDEFSTISRGLVLDANLPQAIKDELYAEIFHLRGEYMAIKGEVDEAINYFNKALECKRALKDQVGLFEILNDLGRIQLARGDIKSAEAFINEAHIIAQELANKRFLSTAQISLGNLYFTKGELEKAAKYFMRSLRLKTELGNPIQIAYSLNNLGTVYSKQGNIEEALKCYRETLDILTTLGKEIEAQTVLNNIGALYHKRGHLSKAEDYYKRSLELREKEGNVMKISLVLHNLGELYLDMNDYVRAKSYLTRALKCREESSDFIALSDTLFLLTLLFLKKEEPERAKDFLNRLEKVAEENSNKIVTLRANLAGALWLKESPRIREKILAAEELKKIISAPLVDHYYTLIAMKAFSDLLLLEYETLKEEEVEGEIKTLMNELYKIAQVQGSPSLQVETHAIQARLSLIKGDLESAKNQLNMAKQVISEKGVGQHIKTISSMFDALKEEFEKWSDLVNENLRTYNDIIKDVTGGIEKLEEGVVRFRELGALPLILSEYKNVIHPIKLTILKILNQAHKMSRKELLKILNINSGTFEKYIRQLSREGYISKKIELIDTKPRTVLYIEHSGIQIYRSFKDTMHQIINPND